MKLTEAQLTRAMFSMWDFQQALSALTFLLEDCDFNEKYSREELRRFRCYETTLIISFCRPLESVRNGVSLGLRALGISLTDKEKALRDRMMHLRRKIIAHSDEDEMHFRVDTFEVDNGLQVPHFQFDEGLLLESDELQRLELFLRRLKQEMYRFFFEAAQKDPELVTRYKRSESMQNGPESDA